MTETVFGPVSGQALTIPNNRGESLAALLYLPGYEESAGAASSGAGRRLRGKRGRGKRRPLVIVCHGFTGSKEGGGRALEMAGQLGGAGYAALLFDFAGCGQSEGSWDELTLSGQVDDLSAVAGWCRENGFSPLIVNGRSFGGATALCCAAQNQAIDGVCTWAALAYPYGFFSALLAGSRLLEADGPDDETAPLASEGKTVYIKRRFINDLRLYDPAGCAARITPRPLLVMHGTADELIPVEEAEIIYQAAGEPKELQLIAGADHRFSGHAGRLRASFYRWLGRCFPTGR